MGRCKLNLYVILIPKFKMVILTCTICEYVLPLLQQSNRHWFFLGLKDMQIRICIKRILVINSVPPIGKIIFVPRHLCFIQRSGIGGGVRRCYELEVIKKDYTQKLFFILFHLLIYPLFPNGCCYVLDCVERLDNRKNIQKGGFWQEKSSRSVTCTRHFFNKKKLVQQ